MVTLMAKGTPPTAGEHRPDFSKFGTVGFVLITAALLLYGLNIFDVVDEPVGNDLLIIGGAGALFLLLANIGPLIESLKWSKDGFELNLNSAINADIQRLTAKIGELEIKVDECTGRQVATPTAKAMQAEAAAAPKLEPPHRARTIIDREDKNNGRFGGADQAGGFRLSASFEGGGDWATVNLAVTADATVSDLQPGEAVEFHLHETFPTPVMRRPLRDGAAHLSFTCWGGFTVGVWIPSRGIELELNLAHVPGAPKVIREH
jgi:hypothetical protein